MTLDAAEPGLALYLAAAHKVCPGLSVWALRDRLRLVLSVLKFRHRLSVFFCHPEHAVLLHELMTRPEIIGFLRWPYVHAAWPVMQRFEALSQHEQAMRSDMAALAVSPTGSLVIADMSDTSAGLRLVIDRAPWFLREGSLVFNQFLHHDRLMSLAFSFGRRDGERVAYVGSVQGAKADSALAHYREVGKDLHGMRSRDFLIKAFQFLTHHLGVKRVLCVGEQARHHRHAYFGKSKSHTLHLNYDQVWQEHAGVRTADGFFRLASLPVVRAPADIAAKNRALYRRRYALMDRLSADIAARFAATNPLPQPEVPHP